MMNVWNEILTSAVISTLISSGVIYMNFQKENRLKYITQERKEWRNKLREIAYQLQGANVYYTMKLLTELKVRINTKGYEVAKEIEEQVSKEKQIGKEEREKLNGGCLEDSHIWYLIFEFEKLRSNDCACNSKELISKQEKMIDYISLLLKDDWERSKEEVYEIKKKIPYPCVLLLLILPDFIVCCYVLKKYNLDDFAVESVTFLICRTLLFFELIFYIIDKLYQRKRKEDYKKIINLIDDKYNNITNSN